MIPFEWLQTIAVVVETTEQKEKVATLIGDLLNIRVGIDFGRLYENGTVVLIREALTIRVNDKSWIVDVGSVTMISIHPDLQRKPINYSAFMKTIAKCPEEAETVFNLTQI